ncbi:hypothetical protein [Streptomyces bluensis]|uniref:hypothetical protein n=1 Tax=Streptomyces bluensis TaxID=33897 RepID=UPI00167A7B8D|nr:hypothetical protein [Streptomyces bluensis]GGZ69846.1 hypothetical protein GCM10010344_41010 [Streptomyces bluensis]
MAVDQLPGQVREFAIYLNKLLTRLDPGGGWCAVFWQRDPEGMRACLDGWEVPPWDVVEALLQDLATAYGPAAAAQEADRARVLHSASLAAHDARPGARDALADRLDVMIREQRYAAERTAELSERLQTAATPEEAEALRLDLAWAQDDHERATARCAEIRARLTNLARRAPHTPTRGAPHFQEADAGAVFRVPDRGRTHDRWEDGDQGRTHDARAPHGRTGEAPDHRDHPGRAEAPAGAVRADESRSRPGVGPRAPGPLDTEDRFRFDAPGPAAPADPGGTAPASEPRSEPPAAPAPKQRTKSKRRPRGSARFAGMMDAEETPPAAVVPTTAEPAPAAPATRTPRGARFAGVADTAAAAQPQPQRRQPLDDEARREIIVTVQTLLTLRRDQRSGEAHVLLAEAAHWPAARYPLLAAELHRVGLGADWATLLWEAASLPADKLVAAADALAEAGRTVDGEQLLRQGVARPAAEIGASVLALADEGCEREVRALLDAYVRIRTPEEAVRSVAADPQRLGPLLLQAARRVSEERHWDLVHALRVAGFTA